MCSCSHFERKPPPRAPENNLSQRRMCANFFIIIVAMFRFPARLKHVFIIYLFIFFFLPPHSYADESYRTGPIHAKRRVT